MQASIETTEGLERKLRVSLPAEPIEAEIKTKLKEVAKTVRLKGFRPGNVPLAVVEKHYGMAVRYEIADQWMRTSLANALEKNGIHPAGTPRVEITKMEADAPFEYTATFEVYPDVKLNYFDSAEVVRYRVDITDADVQKVANDVLKQHATFEAVSRPCQEGDRVIIDFKGTIDGNPIERGAAEDQEIILGSKSMIPGFEEGIAGHNAGESFDITVTFPESYNAAELAGKTALFAIHLKTVEASHLPELTPELFEKLGLKETTLEGFHNELRKNIGREMAERIQVHFKNSILEKFAELNPVPLPQSLVSEEIDALREQAVKQFQNMFGAGKKAPSFKAADLPAEMFEKKAKKRAQLTLLLQTLIREDQFHADAESVRKQLEEMTAHYDDPSSVIEYYEKQPDFIQGIHALVLENKAIEKLAGTAAIIEKNISYDEVAAGALQIKDAIIGDEEEEEHVHDEHCQHDH